MTFKIHAQLRTVVLQSGTLVDILADLGVVFGDDVAAVAGANVSAVGQIVTVMLTAAVAGLRTRTG